MRSLFSEQNLARYKKLASGTLTLTVAERKVIFDCLAGERADFRNRWNARIEGAHVPAEKGHLILFALAVPGNVSV